MKKYELTEEHRAQLEPWKDKWVANAMSTKPMDDNDKAIMREAIKGLYEAANLKPPPPERIVFVASPFIMRFAGGFAAAIWWLRKNKKQDVRAATEDATLAATRAATEAATEAATWAATLAATGAATWAATLAATGAATRAATEDATLAATRAATEAATEAATGAATWAATLAATRAATEDATLAATRAATEAATEAATGAATEDAKPDQSRWFNFNFEVMRKLSTALRLGELGLQCAASAYNMWQGGNQWSGWVAFLSFFRHVAELKLDYSKFDHYEKATIHAGPRIMHAEFCIVSDRPEVLLVDSQNRPHCETGPFCRWRDGSELYALNGVRVPMWLVMTPKDQLDPKKILAEENVEVKREGVRKLGADVMIQKLGGNVIDSRTYDVGGKYDLLSVDWTGSERVYLRMNNPSIDAVHIEPVHPECRTVDQALGFRNSDLFGDKWREKNFKYVPPRILT